MTIIDSYLFSLPLYLRLSIIFIFIFFIALAAFKKKQLTKSGVIAAFVLGSGTMYILGLSGLSVYLFFLLSAAVISKLSKNIRRIEKIQKKGSTRDYVQVLSNGGCAFLAAVLYHFTLRPEFLLVFVAVLAEACSDTWSGDVGVLSKEGPISILTFTKVPIGQSGGISLLGTIAGLLSSLLFGLFYYSLFEQSSFLLFFIVVITSFTGMLFDSFLGATVQIHYYDEKEDLITEKDEIDGRKLPAYRGIKFFDNDMVNLTSNVFTFIFSYLLSFIVLY